MRSRGDIARVACLCLAFENVEYRWLVVNYQMGERRLAKIKDMWRTPGTSARYPRDAGQAYNRPQGMEWVDGKIWVATKAALRIYAATNPPPRVHRRIQA